MTSRAEARRQGGDLAEGDAADGPAEPGERGERRVRIGFFGHDFVPLPSGALFCPGLDTLLVADLHLGKMRAFARAGQMLPPYDTGMTLARLHADLERTGAARLVALGDSFHRDEEVAGLGEADRTRLAALVGRVEWIWLSGNHDPSPHALGGACRTGLALGGLSLCHEPRRGTPGMVAGHLHPAARIAMGGRSVRRPCFVHDGALMILPAYGASTGSLNVLAPAFAGLFDFSRLQVAMAGRGRVYPVGAHRLVRG